MSKLEYRPVTTKKVTVRIEEGDLQQVFDRFPYATQQETIRAALRSAVTNQDNARVLISNMKLKNKLTSNRIILGTSIAINVVLIIALLALSMKLEC